MYLVVEQLLNGLQFGLLLFLLAAGLTLVFGIMDFVNLAHGSLYMMGAYFAATFVAWTGSFVLGALLALGATLLLGVALGWSLLLGLVPLPSKWIIEFGEPVETAPYGAAAAEDPMTVFNLTDQVRENIQQTLYRLLSGRRNAFLG